ncbi:hypothetical protein [Acidihalobacter sp.]|uniref:hypothetical protein n=1 Tax=Acidihalobacter sp. TaxID=1872108 RepID=UPI00307D44B5
MGLLQAVDEVGGRFSPLPDGIGVGRKRVAHDRLEQAFFRAEVRVNPLLVRPGGRGDAVDPRAGRPEFGELLSCGIENPTPRRFRIAHVHLRVSNHSVGCYSVSNHLVGFDDEP